MGQKGSKAGGKPSKVPAKAANLTEKDMKFLLSKTNLNREEITNVFKKFNTNNPDGLLNRNEFNALYQQLRSEPVTNLDEIQNMIFRAFDSDNNGQLTFNEFLICYALTTEGDQRSKLEYAFELYDADNNGWLSEDELKDVLVGMLDLLGADKGQTNSSALAEECAKQLDGSGDGKITKDEFINGLMKNYSLRCLMSPFN